MAVYKRGKIWWYKFNWNGESIRESTKQTNKRVAEQIEAAHRTSLAKGEVGIRERVHVPNLKEFAETQFLPFIETQFKDKSKTHEYYCGGVKSILTFGPLAACSLDEITADKISGYVANLRDARLQVSSINRRLEVLRRMLKLASEWGKVDKALPKVTMLPGERHRDRVLTNVEEQEYLQATQSIGAGILDGYQRALEGIRATARDQQPVAPSDPYLLRDASTILLDCALRPEECFRLRWENIRMVRCTSPAGKRRTHDAKSR
jgi:integrase